MLNFLLPSLFGFRCFFYFFSKFILFFYYFSLSITYSGKVINKNDIINGKAAFHERTISAKQVVNFPVLIDTKGLCLSWTFKTKPKNIVFGIKYYKTADKPENDDEETLLELDSVPSHKDNVNGSIEAHQPGIYVLIFDNNFSK